MSFGYSRRADLAEPFLAMEVMERALELERGGADIVHLEVGEPDFPAPPAAVEACQQALARGETGYTDSRGLAELREAIAADHRRRSGVEVDPDRVIVTGGTSPAMLLVFLLLVEPGDEVVLAAPHYPCYPNFVHVAGGVPVYVETRAEDGYRLDPDEVRAALTPRTRAIVVASPANPTGAIQDAETLAALANLGVPLVSDEIYDGLVYDEHRVTSALGLGEDVFVLDGFSKRYAMTGFRLGYVVAPERAIRPLQTLGQSLFISASHFVQRAGIAALAHGEPTLREMRSAYARRRRLLLDGLAPIGFSVPTPPAGAFYVFANARRFGDDSRSLAFDLLERAHVAVTPGIDFGQAGEGFLRFSYAASDDAIARALQRLGEALS
ncbi:MAG: pyridoxal phosphate-dependent aminotransferase [Deltaproteobacteria bacterium]|nr:pyridoxal phosphate-dependent aminotransferase [Deltaproteobacteria bacterium]MBW2414144.1 pyridoxal phosphate-dependent aminotransferase [Deltaproteobacteria bacterium]